MIVNTMYYDVNDFLPQRLQLSKTSNTNIGLSENLGSASVAPHGEIELLPTTLSKSFIHFLSVY